MERLTPERPILKLDGGTKLAKAVNSLSAFAVKQRQLPEEKRSRPGHLVARSFKRADKLVEKGKTLWKDIRYGPSQTRQSPKNDPNAEYKVVSHGMYSDDPIQHEAWLRGHFSSGLNIILNDLSAGFVEYAPPEKIEKTQKFYSSAGLSEPEAKKLANTYHNLTDAEKQILTELDMDEDKFNGYIDHILLQWRVSHKQLTDLLMDVIRKDALAKGHPERTWEDVLKKQD